MAAANLNYASMSDVIRELESREPTNLELRAALMNAMRRIEELENQIADVDDGLLSLYRNPVHARLGATGAPRDARSQAKPTLLPSGG